MVIVSGIIIREHKRSDQVMKKIMRTAAVFLFTVFLAVSAVLTYVMVPDRISGETESILQENPPESVEVSGLAGRTDVRATVLGDSIAKGYSEDKDAVIEPYGSLAMKQMAEREHFQYEIANYAKNGLDSSGMNEKILTDGEICSTVEKSDIIFITVGSNDLLNECKRSVQEILDTDTKFKSAEEALRVLRESVSGNPLLVFGIIEALENWDYQTFENNWTDMMEKLGSLKKENAEVIVTNIYNPVANLKIPATMEHGVESVIVNMNDIIDRHADEYGYRVADLFHSEVYAHVQKDGLHPDQTGQQIIADQICGN